MKVIWCVSNQNEIKFNNNNIKRQINNNKYAAKERERKTGGLFSYIYLQQQQQK